MMHVSKLARQGGKVSWKASLSSQKKVKLLDVDELAVVKLNELFMSSLYSLFRLFPLCTTFSLHPQQLDMHEEQCSVIFLRVYSIFTSIKFPEPFQPKP